MVVDHCVLAAPAQCQNHVLLVCGDVCTASSTRGLKMVTVDRHNGLYVDLFSDIHTIPSRLN